MSLLSSLFDIAGSALSAESVRMNTVASNLANAETVSDSPAAAYRAREPVFASILADRNGGMNGTSVGVQVLGVVESAAPPKLEYRPHHPMADDKGNVYLPNVNIMEELANLISASRSYQTNVEVLNTSKQLLLRTLDLGN